MNFSDHDVERVARRLWQRASIRRLTPAWDATTADIRAHYRDMAREALTGFFDGLFTVLPFPDPMTARERAEREAASGEMS